MKLGSTVTLTYRGTLDDGTEFGYATAENPMVFQTGMDMVIDGLEKEILSMNEVGEKKSFVVGQYDAYGEYLEDFTQRIPMEQVPKGNVKVGQRIYIANSEDGRPTPVTVLSVEDGMVTFDMNHPLAGQNLNFEVEILAIEDAPENFVSAAEKVRHLKEQAKLLGGDQGDDFR